MRLALVTETYPPEVNGVAMSVERLGSALRRSGHEVELIRPRQRGESRASSESEWRTPGLPIPMYPELRIGLPVVLGLRERWRRNRPDLVHVATEGPLGWAALRAARSAGLPVTSDFRTDFEKYSEHYGLGFGKSIVGGYLRNFHNSSDRTFVPTPQLRGRLASQGYRSLEVIGRGVDSQLYTPARRSNVLRRSWGVDSDAPVALYVGRLAKEKNVPLALRAFAAMKACDPSARLVLVGDGPEGPRLQRSMPQGIFAGRKTGVDLAQHYASADVFLFPSLTDTFGNVTLEALASGLAVVAFRAGAAAVHIDDCVNGVLADPADEQDFIAGACAAVKQRAQMHPLRAAARRTAEASSWGKVADRFEACLLDVLRSHETPFFRPCTA